LTSDGVLDVAPRPDHLLNRSALPGIGCPARDEERRRRHEKGRFKRPRKEPAENRFERFELRMI
jgi:hypothetical protein